ncbi:MAG: hypothetical protein F6K00_00075 [Leptolyngbya sp. SIOISBB]|nr:hypothetical protein [Leptolyngbya sp. SIOISBB]
MTEPLVTSSPQPRLDCTTREFGISPLIRITLLLLYASLTLPLPILANVTQAPVPPWLLTVGILIGGGLLYGGLSERVAVDANGISVRYPRWIRWLLRRQWQLSWAEITALKPRTTGQGGLVYYFISDGEQAFLLPMRIAGFAELLRHIEANTHINTQDIRPLAQPWMYLILLVFSLLLLLIDGWTVWTAAHLAGVVSP